MYYISDIESIAFYVALVVCIKQAVTGYWCFIRYSEVLGYDITIPNMMKEYIPIVLLLTLYGGLTPYKCYVFTVYIISYLVVATTSYIRRRNARKKWLLSQLQK